VGKQVFSHSMSEQTDPDKFLAPLEEPHSPSTFASIVFRGWSMKLSGLAAAVITAAMGYVFGPYGSLVAALMAGIWIYVVCYQAWKSERQRSDGLELQLTKARNVVINSAFSDLPKRLENAETTIETQDQEIEFYKKLLEPQLAIDTKSIKCVLIRYPYNQQARYCRVARFTIENTGTRTVYGIQATIH
jgi:hypothetical protein